ncbi:MAG TPA: TolC family protein, partial [Rhodothermales bacterium]|nr:TolC family protein [Rhodothermales bacterium]
MLPCVAQAQVPVPATSGVSTADSLNLSLEEAIARAAQTSEEVRLAQSQTDLAEAQIRATRSQALPQISGNVGYTRTLASAFDTGGGGFTLPDSLQFNPNPNASIEERIRYLEQHTPTAGLGSLGQLFGDLPFGQANAYSFSVAGSQLLYSGGRTGAALRIARHFREASQFNLREQLADVELQVRSAYYQAQFAQQLITISEAAIERAQRFLEEEQLRLRAGRASDLDVLRAEVELENLRPQLVQARNTADLS